MGILFPVSCFLFVAALALIGCGGPRTELDLGRARVVERGALAYQATMVGTRMLASVELGLRFELVVRRIDGSATQELGRIDLGPPDWDTTGLAAAAVGPIVWVSSRDGTVRAIDVSTLEISRAWPIGAAVTAIAVGRDGERLAYGTSSGVLCLRRTRDGALLQCIHQGDDEITALAFGESSLASATAAGAITFWSLPALRVRSTTEVDGPVSALAFGIGGALAVAVGQRPGRSKIGRGDVRVISEAGAQVSCEGHTDSVTAIAWTADGSSLASGSIDGRVRLWRPQGSHCQELGSRSFGRMVSFLVNPASGAFLAVGLWAKGRDEKTAVFLDYLYPSR